MADLEYTVKVSGVEDVERLEKNLDNLHRTLNAGSGAGKSLEEMRKILVGMRGQASVIADLRDSVKSLNTAAENLGKGFDSGFSRLDKTLKQGFQLTLDRVNMLGAEMSKGLASGVKGAFDAGTQAAAAGGKKVAAAVRAAGEDATSELAAWHAKDIKLNAKYATDLGVAQQQVLDKGTSTMVTSLRKRAEVIARLLQEEGTVGQEVATKAYGTDFVNAVKAGLIGQQKLFEDHIQTVKKLGEAQVDAYVGKMNQQAVERARAVAKEQLEANARAIKEELAAAADAFAKSPDTLANMQKFYALQASVAQASTDRAREIAKAQFQANSRAIKEELAAAAQAHMSSEETLRSMRQFYTWQASVAQAATDRAREIAKAQFQANSRAIKEELAAAAQAHLSSEETLRSMRQFYTWQASVAQAATDRARAVAKAQFQANSRAIKEELAAAAAAYAKSPDTLANMRKFYTMQESAAKYVEERARKEAREAFAARSKAFKEEAAKFSESSYDVGMRQLASQYTDRGEIKAMEQLRLAADAAAVSQKNAAAAADPLSKALKGLAIDGNDTHSAMRGLASGFNLLWLTWGNLAPLFAGAIISNGFMQTAKQGMEVAHTLAVIENIGGNTKEEMAALSQELVRLGTTGTFGPKDVAEAMKTLSLAGLKANEILSATQSTLNFSIAGTTSIQTAADTLVSVSTAFGMGAQGFERVGDVISKAAAESKTSVESFANAMKTASVINAQYGVSLEDTATAIAAMSQLGIEGTAAGTALRNMYADLSGRSIQVSKILKAQGIEMRNLATGGFKPMTQVVAELSDHFDTLTAIGQKNLMQALLSERGAKGLVEMLRLIKLEAKDTSKGFANALEEMRKNIEDSYGFTAVNAAKLSQTTKSLFEQVGATFKTSMYEAYTEVEPTLSMIAKELKQAFASEEFKQALTDLVRGVAEVGRSLVQVGVFITDNLVTIGLLAAGYKAFATAIKITTAAQLAQTAATRADTVANTANAASQAGKLAGLAGLARFLPGVGTAITVAAGAWALYDAYQRDASASSLDFARSYTTDVVKALNDETSKLQELNRLRLEGLSLTEAQARLDDMSKRTQYVDPYAKAVNEAIRAEMDARAELASREEEYAGYPVKDNKHRVEEQLTRVKRLAAATRAAKAEELEAIAKVDEATRAAVDARKEAAKLDEQEFEARRKALQKFGEGTFELGQKDSFAKAGRQQLDLMRDNELESLKSHFDSQLKSAKEFYDAEKKLLDQRNSANLISEQEYLASSMTLAIKHQTDQLAVLDKMQQEYDAASGARIEKLQSQQAAAKGKAAQALINAIKKEQQAAEISNNAFDVKRAEIAAEAYGRVGEVLNKVQADVGKLIESNKEFWDNRALEKEALKAAEAIDAKYANMNTSIMSMDVAMYEFEKAQHAALVQSNKQNDALRRRLALEKDLVVLMKSALQARIAAGGSSIEEVAAYKDAIWTLEDGVNKLETQLTESTAKGLEDGAKAGMDAFAKARKKQADELAAELANAVTDGLMSGDYKSVGKSIRDILQRELIRKPLQAWIQAVVGSVLGGSAAQASAGTGQMQGFGNLFSGNSGLTLGTSFGNWLSDTGFTMASGANLGTISSSLGNSMLDLGNTITQWDSTLQAIPGFEGGFGSVFAYGKAIFDIAEGNYGSGVGTAAGAYLGSIIPGIGTAIGSFVGGTLGGLLDGVFGSNPKEHSGGVYTSSGTRDEGLRSLGLGKHAKGDFTSRRNESIDKALDSTMTALLNTYDQLAKSTKGAVRQLDIIAAFATNPITTSEDAYGYLQIFDKDTRELLYKNTQRDGGGLGNDPEKAFSLFTGQVISVMVKELKSADLPSWMSSIFAKLGEDVTLEGFQEALTVINSINIGFASLAATMEMFVGISDDMKSALLGAFGGIEGLSQATQAYYDNFYTEAERLTIAGRNMNQVMQSLGLDIDVMDGNLAKEAFRKTVEAAFEAGNGSLAAALLGVSGQFAEIADAAQAATDNLGTAEGAIISYGEALANLAEKAGYLGSTNRYAAENAAGTIQNLFANIGIEKDVTSLTSSILAATTADVEDFFRELWPLMQTDAARDQLIQVADALLDVAARSRELDTNLATLQDRFGDSGAVNSLNLDYIEKDLASFGKAIGKSFDFETIRSQIESGDKDSIGELFNSVFWNLDSTEVKQKFINITNSILDVVEAAEAAAKAISDERLGLENKLLTLQGNTVELRKRELEAIHESNRGLQLHIWALEDLADAQSKYDSAVNAVSSAEAAVQSVRDKATSNYLSALEKVKSIQQQIAEDFRSILQSLLDYLHSFEKPTKRFADVLKKALAGDADSMRELPGLADSAIASEKDASSSLLDFQRRQAEILNGIRAAAKVAELKAATGADKSLSAQEELLLAQKELAEAARIANEIGASLADSQEDIISEYQKANADLIKAIRDRDTAAAELEDIKRQLAAIEKNTYLTNYSVKGLKFQIDAAEIRAKLEVDAVINSKVYEELPEATKALVLGTQDSLRRAIDVIIADTGLTDNMKLLGIGTVDNITKNINLILNNPELTDNLKAIGIGQLDDFTKYISTVISDVSIPTDVKDLLLSSAANPYVTATSLLVNLSSSLTSDQRLVLQQAQGTIKKIVDAAVSGGTITADQRKILDQASATVRKTAETLATGGTLTDGQKKILDAVTGNTSIAASVSLENKLAADGGMLAYSKADVKFIYDGLYVHTSRTADILQQILNLATGTGMRIKFDRGESSASGKVYATGGAFTNGVVHRPTFFSESLMGEAGPEAIMPLTNIGGSLGVRATMPDNSELIAEVKALRALVVQLIYANEATARNTHATRKQLERWDGDGIPETRDTAIA